MKHSEELISKGWEWVPIKSFGPFIIGAPISQYLNKYSLKKIDFESGVHYELEDPEIAIAVENGKIESINCFEECYYKGVNLIGGKFQEVSDLLQEEPFDVDELYIDILNENQKVYTYEASGLQIWVRPNGTILNVICSDFSV